MSVDLVPVRRGWESYHSGSFSWSWMLSEGVGLPIGCGDFDGVQHMWTPRRTRGRSGHWFDSSPYDNDGFCVTAHEAKAMAMAAWGLVQRQNLIQSEWDKLPADEQARINGLPFLEDRDPKTLRRIMRPVRKDFVEKAERFAWFAWGSRGFRIY